MSLITIKTFENAVEAHLLRLKLENEDIQCFLVDENTVSLNPLFNIAIGGIKLRIDEGDEAKAQELIAEMENAAFLDEDEQIIACPKCQSTDLYTNFKSMKGAKGAMSAIISFLFMVFPIYYKSVYKCKECGHEFK
jgi:DNA-directed RNA polymerase subunit RPC12/RpoP